MSKIRPVPLPYSPPEGSEYELIPANRANPRVWAQPQVYNLAPHSRDTGEVSELMALLGRRKLKIALCALAGVLLGLVVGAYTPPTYRARTSLQLEDFRDMPLLRAASVSQSLPGASVENYLQNQVKLLESETLARRVADQLGIEAKPVEPGSIEAMAADARGRLGVPVPGMDPDLRRVEEVKDALTVRTSLQSQVIELLYDAPTPALAAAGANQAATQFIEMNREARSQVIEDATAWLSQQAQELRAKLEADQGRLQSFATASGLVFAGSEDTLAQDRMRKLQEALVRAEAERASKQSRYEAIAKSGKLVSDAGVNSVQQFENDLQTVRRELAQLRTIYTPNHQKVVAAEAQIRELEQALKNAHDDAVARVQNDYTAAAGFERMLADSQRRELATIERQMNQQRHYEVIKSEADTTQRLYESVLENLKEAGAASSLRTTNVRVIDAAVPPAEPYSPNFAFNAAVGFGLGTLGGVGLVLFRGRSRKVARPGETVLFNLPELGVIPSARHAWSALRASRLLPFQKKPEPGLVTWTHDSSPLSESYRATLNSILFGTFLNPRDTAREDQPAGRVLTVTSFDPMAGKTTVLANLAVASAERKLRVLVIDADLRRPRIHSLFNLANDWGLTDVLDRAQTPDYIRTAPLESLVRPTHISGLWVLPSGPGNAAIPSLLYSTGLKELLRRFRSDFDLVFVDSPPLMLYSDARFLGRTSDGLVMVVRANTRSREELRLVYARLMQDRIRVIGTVLNAWEMDSHQSREYGAHYYRYQQPADRTA